MPAFQSLQHPSPVQPPGVSASWHCQLNGTCFRSPPRHRFVNLAWLSVAIQREPFLRMRAAACSGTASQDALSVKGEVKMSINASSDDSSDEVPGQSHLDLLEKLTTQSNRGGKSTGLY
eukprot:c18829_g1_i2 orf=60-416(+)